MRILIPVNGTPECEIAIPLAQELADEVDADIYLVRVVELIDPLSGAGFDPDTVRMMNDAAGYLVDLVSRFKLPEERTRPLVSSSDDAAKEIIGIAEREGIDLVILASRGEGWLQRLAEGDSLCSHLVRSRVCPVLCVPLPSAAAGRGDRATAEPWPQPPKGGD